jgi:hypothetical protein
MSAREHWKKTLSMWTMRRVRGLAADGAGGEHFRIG